MIAFLVGFGVFMLFSALDFGCYLAAVRRAGRVGSFWQGVVPGSGFYYLARPERLRRTP